MTRGVTGRLRVRVLGPEEGEADRVAGGLSLARGGPGPPSGQGLGTTGHAASGQGWEQSSCTRDGGEGQTRQQEGEGTQKREHGGLLGKEAALERQGLKGAGGRPRAQRLVRERGQEQAPAGAGQHQGRPQGHGPWSSDCAPGPPRAFNNLEG